MLGASHDDDVCRALDDHVRRFFSRRADQQRRRPTTGPIAAFTWAAGPISQTNPHFRVLEVAPQFDGDVWTYVTVGGWAGTEDLRQGFEFILCTATQEPRAVEILAMTVHFNHGGKLGLVHVVPVGQPWLPTSRCDRLLVSLPYPFGPDLQSCHVGDRHVEFHWLLPITAAERDFRNAHGLDALEARFDEVQLAFWDVSRPSVV